MAAPRHHVTDTVTSLPVFTVRFAGSSRIQTLQIYAEKKFVAAVVVFCQNGEKAGSWLRMRRRAMRHWLTAPDIVDRRGEICRREAAYADIVGLRCRVVSMRPSPRELALPHSHDAVEQSGRQDALSAPGSVVNDGDRCSRDATMDG